MRASNLGLACLVVVGALAAPGTNIAQQADVDVARPAAKQGDKSQGESWQIEQRRRWWIESRDLKENARAADQRRASLSVMRRQLVQQAEMGIRSQAEPWREIGPSSMKMGNWAMGRVSGRINVVTPHPTNDSIVFIGAANGGVWKTTNAGLSWTPTFVDVGSQSISALHVETGSPDNVWAGTGDRFDGDCSGYLSDGVFFSSDGGLNWSPRNNGMRLSTITSLVTDANNDNVVLAAGFGDRCNQGGDANGGIYRSTDKGATWTEVMDRKVEDLVAIAGTSTIYASAPGSGVYRSDNGGANWTLLGAANTASRMRLAVARSNVQVIYALTNTTLYRSDNGGGTWNTVSTTACDGQCTYNLSLDVNPTDPQTLIVGAIRPRRSTNGGSSFTTLTNQWGISQQVHQDTHAVRYSRNLASRIWIGGDGGLWRTDDSAISWVNMNANLNITQYYDIVVHPTDPNIVYGGAQDNSSSRRSTTNVWDLTVVNGDGFMNAIDDTSPAIVFQNGYPNGSVPSIYRSTQSGAPGTFASVGSSGLTGGGFPWVTPTDVAGGFHFVGGYYVSRASASASTMSWTTISPRVSGTVSVITAKRIGSAVHVYAGTDSGKIYYTANGASSQVVDVSGSLPAGRISDVAIDPTNGSRAFLTRASFSGAKLYRTTSGGGTWAAVGAGLPNIPANTVVIDPRNLQRVFVGTDIGVYESTDNGANFAPFSDGMPAGLVISDLEIDDSPHVLTAGTYGRGAWQTTLSSGSGTTYAVSGTITSSTGAALGGVSVSNGSSTVSTNSSGVYTFTGLINGTYTLTPSLSGYTFAPATRSVSVNGANVSGQSFTGTATTSSYSVSGTITTSAGAALGGVSVSNGSSTVSTNSSGVYTFTGLSNGTYTLTPSLSGYTFSPATRSVSVNGANVSGQSFTGTATTSSYSVSGTITTSAGAAISGVSVSNGSSTVSTNSSGVYTFTGLINGTYTLTPSLSGYTFSPATRSVSVNGANVSGQSFTGTASAGNWLSQSGTLTNGAAASVPSSPGYAQGGTGTYQARLTGPSNADFDLTLLKWNGASWVAVASSTGPTSTESINYSGTAGYYTLQVRSYSGSGTYNVQYLFPRP